MNASPDPKLTTFEITIVVVHQWLEGDRKNHDWLRPAGNAVWLATGRRRACHTSRVPNRKAAHRTATSAAATSLRLRDSAGAMPVRYKSTRRIGSASAR